MAVKANGRQMAIHKETLRQRKVANTSLGGLRLVALYDAELDVVRVFGSSIEGKAASFSYKQGRIGDELTQSDWTPGGRALSGKLAGTQLKRQASFDVMWFAWYAFFPETQVVA